MLRNEINAVATYLGDRLMQERFWLVDVGCSGGIDAAWRAFAGQLSAIAIDPNRSEIVRLTAAESNPEVRYFAAFAGLPEGHPVRQLHSQYGGLRRNPWHNMSDYIVMSRRAGSKMPVPAPVRDLRAQEIMEARLLTELDMECFSGAPAPIDLTAIEGRSILLSQVNADDSARQFSLAQENRWHEADLVADDCTVNVADLLDALKLDNVDFIKIDVDGADYEVLYSLKQKLNEMNVLGCALEVNFIGSDRPHHHTFHNTDRLMRQAGFGLFGLTVRPYASASLPAPFLLPYPAQTTSGRPMQGDALYLRDFGLKLDSADADNYSWEKIAKLIALFAMFGLPDQAAETALRFRNRLAEWFNVDTVLDLLAAQMQEARGVVRGYSDYLAEYDCEDPWFFDAQHR